MKKVIIKPEIYSRVSGYYRPVQQWNKGKQSEFDNRKPITRGIYEKKTEE